MCIEALYVLSVRIGLSRANCIGPQRDRLRARLCGGGLGVRDLKQPDYLRLNPSAVVPTLIDGDIVLTQTSAIMEYLDETHPSPPLLPADSIGRARVRAMAQVMISDTHPLSTARVIDYLDASLELEKERWQGWLRHWKERGFGVIERMLADDGIGGAYCHGDMPTMADIAVVSQVFVARKFGFSPGDACLRRMHGPSGLLCHGSRETAGYRLVRLWCGMIQLVVIGLQAFFRDGLDRLP